MRELDNDVEIISEQNVKVKTESELQNNSDVDETEPGAEHSIPLSRPVRDRKLPNRFKDYVLG